MAAPTFYVWADLAYAFLALSLGLWVFLIAPRKRVNRLLFWVLIMEAAGWAGFGLSAAHFLELIPGPLGLQWGGGAVNIAAFVAILPVYIVFVGHAAPSAWNAWLRHRGAQWVALAASVFTIVMTPPFLRLADTHPGAASVGFNVLIMAAYVFALATAVSHLRAQTKGSNNHRRAKLVAFAVLMRDLPWLVLSPVAAALLYFDAGPATTVVAWRELLWIPFLLAFLVASVIGVFQGQLVDVDRKLHFTVSRGTVAAFFIGIFVGVQSWVSEYFSSTAGLMAGAASAGILVFAMSPLQRLADGLADKAVPRGGKSSMTAKEQEIFYQEQVEIAYSDGQLGAKDRAGLRAVRLRLGLDAEVALAIEDRVAR